MEVMEKIIRNQLTRLTHIVCFQIIEMIASFWANKVSKLYSIPVVAGWKRNQALFGSFVGCFCYHHECRDSEESASENANNPRNIAFAKSLGYKFSYVL